MHRFYIPPEQSYGDLLTLTGSEAHHAAQVLRISHGDKVMVLNGAGSIFDCEVQTAHRSSVALRVLHRHQTSAPAVSVTLLQALPKGKIIESIIQKATELGVSRIIPLLTERVVAHFDEDERAAKQSKWQVVAIEAIKQCGLAWLPKVEKPQTLREVQSGQPQFSFQLVGSLRPDAQHPRAYFKHCKEQRTQCASAAVWVGPEGDFTAAEMDAIQAGGALPITLGPLVLRCETAALFCLSVLNYELQGDLNTPLP